MFTHILMPVDLSVPEAQGGAIAVAADLARVYGARITLVSVAGGLSAKVSNSPGLYAERLEAFAAGIATTEGVEVAARVLEAADPTVQVDRLLLGVIGELGIDLVVMATHRPHWSDYLINSHGGRMALHAPVSVMLVR